MIENLSKFTDNNGDVWTIVLTPEKIDRVKEDCDFDLLNDVSKLIGMDVSPTLQISVVTALLHDEMGWRGMDKLDFVRRLDHKIVLRSVEAILWAVVDYADHVPEGLAMMKDAAIDLIAVNRKWEAEADRRMKEKQGDQS